MHPLIIKMYRDAESGAQYTAETQDVQGGAYTVFEGWNNTKMALRYLYGSKAFDKHELALRSKFVSKYKRVIKQQFCL